MERFPPESSRVEEVEMIVGVFATVLPGREAIYVSAPLTTGQRYLVWRAGNKLRLDQSDAEQRAQHFRHVVVPNREEVERLVRRLRRRYPVIIDPSALPDLPGWTQDDYRVLWGVVIERYAAKVVFAEGWEYSNGSAYEYLVATRKGVRTVDATEKAIDPSAALGLLEHAVREIEDHGEPVHFLRAARAELERLG